jgi:protein-S-isoprenylcysteine O-methyltransferase Ste14
MTKDILQHLVSLILPVIALILVPSWIEPHITRGGDAAFTAGAGLMLIGLLIMGHTIASFIRIGKGTLAPWSPTSRLIIEGLYAYVRNPMILGVIIVLLGEALRLIGVSWAGRWPRHQHAVLEVGGAGIGEALRGAVSPLQAERAALAAQTESLAGGMKQAGRRAS